MGTDDAIGAGELSDAALARLARASPSPLVPPARDDQAAVSAWRDTITAAWLDGDPSPEACGHRADHVAGVPVLRSAPVADGPLMVYLHGGGTVLGSPAVAVPITERLATGGLEVVSVQYRLAPEHPCPAAIDDAAAVVAALAGDRPLVVAGDSAGANLALSCALRDRDAGDHAIAGLVLFSPQVDHRPHRSSTDRSNDPQRPSDLDAAGARWFTDAYRGTLSVDDPMLSPLWADLAGLAPVLIQVGTIDTCFEQGARLARRARNAGVDVTLDVWDGLWHTWHYHRDLPEADRALAEAAAWARRLSASGR
ncbi:MAG: alpha/beta hydrolase fold domain-containing protein [Actinomycetota bacterium]